MDDTKRDESGRSGFFQRAVDRIARSAQRDPRRYADGSQGFGHFGERGMAYGEGNLARADQRGWGEGPVEPAPVRATPRRDPYGGEDDRRARFVGHARSGFDRTGAGYEPPFAADAHVDRSGGGTRQQEPSAKRTQRDDTHEQREHGQPAEGMTRRGE